MAEETRREPSFAGQLTAMVRRNFLLKKRERRRTTAEVVLPLYTLGILIVLKLVVPNPHFPPIDVPRGEANVFEYFENLRNRTVAVAPNTTDVQKFLGLINELWLTMHPNPGRRPIGWDLFASEQELVTSYWKNPLSIPLAVVFEEPGPLDGQLIYKIKVNPAVSRTPSTTELFTSPANCRQVVNHWSSVLPIESGDSCPVNQYYYSGFVALQALIDYTKIRFDTGRSDVHVPHVTLELMPKPAHTADWLLAFRVVIPLYMVMAVSQFITYLLILIVGEKERKIKEGMKIMGLRDSVYWLSWFVIYAVFVTFVSAVCCIILYCLNVFAHTNHWLLFLLVTLYSYTIIMFGFMITPFFDKSRTAGVVGSFAVTLMSFLYYIQVFVDKSETSVFWMLSLISSSGFALAMDKALVQDMAGIGTNLDNMWSGPGIPFGGSLIMMIVDIFLYALLAYYLDSVIPSEYGTRRPVFFFLSKSYWCPDSGRKKKIPAGASEDEENNPDVEPVPAEMKGKEAIRICDVVKVYKSCRKPELRAVDGINLTIYEGQITAILGHNGAGKTTLVNILTGLARPTSGTARVFGRDVRDRDAVARIRRATGVCPQRDILLEELTAREHLELFAAIKGGSGAGGGAEDVERALRDVGLAEKAECRARGLSGGQRRKLSVGIAIVGDPKIIFLDEPTAGVDPISRRHLWSALRRLRKGRVIVLTTHFMDEADVLAERKAVVSRGRLRCCGSSLFLKNKFGVGYRLTLALGASAAGGGGSAANERTTEDAISRLVSERIPGAEKARRHGNELSFVLPYNDVEAFAGLFSALEEEIARNRVTESGDSVAPNVTSYGISMTTLEEVFLNLEKDEEESDETAETSNAKRTAVRERALSRSLSLQSKSASYHSLQNEGTNSLDRDRTLDVDQIRGLDVNYCDATPNLLQTFAALIRLRALRLVRDFRKLYITIGVPLLCAIGGLTFFPRMMHQQTAGGAARSNALVLNGTAYGPLATLLIQNSTDGALDAFADAFSSLGAFSVDFYDKDFAGLLEIAPKMAVLNVSTFSDPEFFVTAIYNDTMQHSLPVLVNFVTNALYWMQTAPSVDRETYRPIVVAAEPFPLTTQPPGVNFTTFVLACFLGTLFVLVPVSLAIDIVYDREIKAKNQLRVNGLSRALYFATFLVVQAAVMLAIGAGLLAVVVVERVPSLDRWPALSILGALLALYTAPAVLFSAALNYAFDKTDSAQSIMPNAVTFVGMIPFVLVGMLDMLGINRMLTLSLHTTFSLLNTMYIPYAIFYYVQRTYMICGVPDICDTLTVGHYLSTEIYVIVVGMAVQIPIYSVVLMVADVLKGGGSISDVFRCMVCKSPKSSELLNAPEEADVGSNEDADVKAERDKVSRYLGGPTTDQTGGETTPPVVLIQNLHKTYAKRARCSRGPDASASEGGGAGERRAAVRSLSLAVEAGEVFGLLGHNGAGKTTTMRIVVGEEAATRGRVLVDGRDVQRSAAAVLELLGYCPQHDALWKDITVREHLECYAAIRGVPSRYIPTMIDLFLSGLRIKEHADKKAHQCSGGTKRKLSFAMAMIGNPRVVLLDEPSTGMDPRSKRFLWDAILASFQGKRGAILTTHSMEEADALCSRVGIMVKGELRCLGSTQHLKDLYGAGYTLEIKLRPDGDDPQQQPTTEDRLGAVRRFVADALFADARLDESFADRLVFAVPQRGVRSLAKVFTELERAKSDFAIEEYSFSQTTLEQVFLKFAQYDEVDDDESS